jgi:uncharacterized protein YndB with AHSA1/START domain
MSTGPGNEVTIVRVLDAPRDKVWRALEEPEALARWWGLPMVATMLSCKVDFRLGGTLHCAIAMPGNPTFWFKWIYREIVAGERLVLEQHFSDASGAELDSAARPVSTITLVLEDTGAKTQLTVEHAGMASDAHRVEDYRQGWSESLDRLAASLAQA